MTKKHFLIFAAISVLILSWAAIVLHNTTKRNNTARLYIAMVKNDSATARELIDQGADIDTRNGPENRTPLMLACINKNTELAKLLVEKGADVNSSDINKVAALSYAILHCKLEIVRLLIEKGAHINDMDLHGNTPLYYASAKGKLGIARLLIEKGADVNIRNSYGFTPLDIAYTNGQSKTAALLANNGAKGTVAANNQTVALQEQEAAPVDTQDKSNSPEECAKLAGALKACDQASGFMAMGCKALAKSQFDCPAVARYM